MSGYRRAPNVSQYLANLNNPNMEVSSTNDFIQDDLGQFDFSTEFFDYDMGQAIPALPGDDFTAGQTDSDLSSTTLSNDAIMNANFNFNDFSFDPSLSTATASLSSLPASTFFPRPSPKRPSSSTTATSPVLSAKSGDKRKLDQLQQIADPQVAAAEVARVAAEEDKRRRNTAASARFRIKKKQREQALEKTAREMTEKASMLETKVQQLEMENTWLKSLITEKTVPSDDEASDDGAANDLPVVRASKSDLEEMWKSFREGQEQSVEPEKGVGTSSSSKRSRSEKA